MSADDRGRDSGALRWSIYLLFFLFGGVTSLNDVLVPKLKGLFHLNFFQANLVQFAFFGAYLLISLPAAALVKRIGFLRSASVGLLVMTAGCLLFAPASAAATFWMFLAALFVLAAGVTVVQVVTNPLISMLGPQDSAPSRLTFAQAFNALGTTIFPFVGAQLILGSLQKVDVSSLTGAALTAFRTHETQVVVSAYFGLALTLAAIAGFVWLGRNSFKEDAPPEQGLLSGFGLLKQPRFAFGAACIFLYVGAEVAIGSNLTNYLMQASTLGLAAVAAGKLTAFYWGGAMVGRFIGSAAMQRFAPNRVLIGVALGAASLLLVSGLSQGVVSGYAIIAIGLCNSIMFPTIFSLASAGLGPRAADGSGIICVAIVGGAIIPPLTGQVADMGGLRLALIVPALCYLVIAAFGRFCGQRSAV